MNETLVRLNPLPNDKILDLSKMKAFPDKKIDATQKVEICFG